jgi:L-amino acid N-acyltransferase YncA
MSQAQATKTLRQPLEHRPDVSLWFTTTKSLFNQVAAFYWQVLNAHPAMLDLPAKETHTRLEQLTHTLRSPLDVQTWFDGIHPIIVVEADPGDVIAFASTTSYRPRSCYAGIAEASVYVRRQSPPAEAGSLSDQAPH